MTTQDHTTGHPLQITRAPRRVRVAVNVGAALCSLLYRRRPNAALSLASVIGRAAAAFHLPVDPARVAALLREPLGPAHKAIARDMARNHHRHAILARMIDLHGIAPLAPAVRWTGLELLVNMRNAGTPAIIAVTHLGPSKAILAAFHQAGLPLLFVGRARHEMKLPAGLRVLGFHGSQEARALWLKAGLDHLKRGGMLGLAIDGAHGSAGDEPGILGTGFRLRRGVALIHRLSSAPVVPVSAHWDEDGRHISVAAEAPLPLPTPNLHGRAVEAAMQQATHRWLEAHIRKHPGELRLEKVLRDFRD